MAFFLDRPIRGLIVTAAMVLAMPAQATLVVLSGGLDNLQVVAPVYETDASGNKIYRDPGGNIVTTFTDASGFIYYLDGSGNPQYDAAVKVIGSTPTKPDGSPISNSTATGFATVKIDTATKMMTVDFSWSGLTGPADRAHLHDAPAGVSRLLPPHNMFFDEVIRNDYENTDPSNPSQYALVSTSIAGGPVLCKPTDTDPYCAPSTGSLSVLDDLSDPSNFQDDGQFADFDALLAAFVTNGIFLDIHTVAFPGGEIRGQLLLNNAPEPDTIALLALALAGIVFTRRRNAKGTVRSSVC